MLQQASAYYLVLLGSILDLPGLKFYLLYREQGKTRPHDRTASELGKQGIFFPSMLQTRKTRVFFPSTLGKQGIFFPSTLGKQGIFFLAR